MSQQRQSGWRFRVWPAAWMAVAILGCDSLGPESPLPAGAEPMELVSMELAETYRAWWTKTEGCAGLRGSFDNVSWYVVPGVETFPTEMGQKVGLWTKSSAGARIIIAGDYVGHELVVRHEILHDLLSREGHPDEYFKTRCHLTWDTYSDQHDLLAGP